MHSALRYAIVACLIAIVGCFSESAAAAQGRIELQWFGQSATKITTVAASRSASSKIHDMKPGEKLEF